MLPRRSFFCLCSGEGKPGRSTDFRFLRNSGGHRLAGAAAPRSDIPPSNAVFTGAGIVFPMLISPALAVREPVWYNRFRSKKAKTHDRFAGQSSERRSLLPRVSAI